MNAKWSLFAENESEKKSQTKKSCVSAIYIWWYCHRDTIAAVL